jgi:hypothetical protein
MKTGWMGILIWKNLEATFNHETHEKEAEPLFFWVQDYCPWHDFLAHIFPFVCFVVPTLDSHMQVQDIHSQCLIRSTALSGYYTERLIAPLEVIRVLNDAGVRFLLVGLHGIGGWMRKPRATEDVDVLVASRGHKKAVKALLEAFPYLEAQDQDVVTRLRDPESDVVKIDLIKPNQPLFREVIKHGHPVTSGGLTYSIPTLEAALAMKFAPMISLNRAEAERYQDAHDFMYMISSNPEIDLRQLEKLGTLVYPSGGKEILEMVRKVRAGEKLAL